MQRILSSRTGLFKLILKKVIQVTKASTAIYKNSGVFWGFFMFYLEKDAVDHEEILIFSLNRNTLYLINVFHF